jgi:hypothetical protein
LDLDVMSVSSEPLRPTAPVPREPTPSREHVAVHRAWARHATDEELYASLSDAEWLLARPDDTHYPAAVMEQSRLQCEAVIAAATAELEHRAGYGVSRGPVDLGYDRALLDELKAGVRLADEVSWFVALRPQGRSLVGLCPFHDDHDPSLVIWPERQRWRCFACGASGDVITWTQMVQRCTFREAVEYLAGRCGEPIPDRQRRQSGPRVREVRVA